MCFFIVVATITIISFIMTPQYEATAKILVETTQSSSFFSEINFFKSNDLIQTKVEILRSKNLIMKVVKTLKLDEKPEYLSMAAIDTTLIKDPQQRLNVLIEWLQYYVVFIDTIKDSNIITIKTTLSDPVMAAKISNTIADFFMKENTNYKKEEASSTYNFLEKELKTIKTNLNDSEEALKKFKEEKNIVSLPDVAKVNLERLSTFDAQYLDAKRQCQELEIKIKQISGQIAQQNKEIVVSTNLVNNPIINDFKKRLFDLELQLSDAAVRYSEKSREVEELRGRIEEVKKAINDTVEKTVGSEVKGVNPVYQDLLSELVKSETDLAIMQTRQKALKQVVDEYSNRISSLPDNELRLANLTREKNNNETLYALYLKKLEETKIAKNMNDFGAAFVQIIENAFPPLLPVKPKKTLNILLGIIVGIIVGIGMAFFLEFFDHTLHTSVDVEKNLNIPVLGAIPRSKFLYFSKKKAKKNERH
ncbi:MAG: hypothetical protein HY934_02865 [Candidatus Firestonebacteria bacterium]|nr:hypothetical protein [Candidatus Firestonebacteria bacterium]